MNEIIERMARAHMRASYGEGTILDGEPVPKADFDAMRAALQSLREPTEATIRAVDEALHKHWPNAREMAVAVHHAIVDTALISHQDVSK